MYGSYKDVLKRSDRFTPQGAPVWPLRIHDEQPDSNEINMNEVWKPCPGFEGLYDVSNFGRMRSHRSKPARILALGTDSNGYTTVALSKNGPRTTKTVHRLVCLAFHGAPDPETPEAAHLDGNRTNARADNLRWVSKVENHSHKRMHGTNMAGEKHPNAKLTEEAVAEIRGSVGLRGAIAAKYGVSKDTVTEIRSGRRWSHSIGRKAAA